MGYREVILADTPLAYYRLGESSGASAADETGNGHTATYHGTVTYGVAGALTGDANTAISFDGTSGYADVTLDLSGTDKVSVEFWGKIINPFTNGGYWYDQGSGANNLWALPNVASTYHRIGETGGAGANTAEAAAVGLTGVFAHYVYTFDRAQSATNCINLYTNGSAVSLSHLNTFDNNGNFANSVLRIARGQGHNPYNTQDFLPVTLDEFAVYTYILSASQALTHYNAGLGVFAGGGAYLGIPAA